MEEVWKDIRGFEGRFQVSNMGRIKKLPVSYYRDYEHKKNVLVCYWPERIEKITPTGKVRMYERGHATRDLLYNVSILVAEAFIDNYKEGMEVRHKDGDVQNNAVTNLILSWPESIPNEEWKDIRGFEGRYQVSNMGRVRSLDRWTNHKRSQFIKGKILKPTLNKKEHSRYGYYHVSLSDGSRNYSHFEVHRLVALHFVPGYEEGLVVNHINEYSLDNRAENLEWCTFQYNLNYSDVVAWKRRPVYQYSMEGDFIAKHKCCADIEKLFGTYQGAMVHTMYESKTGIWKGYRWSYEQRTKEQWQDIARKHKSSRKPVAQYDEQWNEIARFTTATEASKMFGVTVSAICYCCNGKTKRSAGYRWKYL